MKIKTIKELLEINQYGSYILTNDINCEGVVVDKIIGDFSGIIDGNNYTVRNLTINFKPFDDSQILSMITTCSGAIIKNLKFENLNIYINNSIYKPRFSIFCGEANNSHFQNIYISVNINKDKIPFIYLDNNSILDNIHCIINGNKIL